MSAEQRARMSTLEVREHKVQQNDIRQHLQLKKTLVDGAYTDNVISFTLQV